MTAVYLSFVALTAALTVIAIYHARNRYKVLAYFVFVALLIGAPMVYFNTLSRPKNLTDEIRNDEQVRVLTFYSDDGHAVYYWLQLPGIREPRYYYEPWSEEAKKRAEDMQQMMENQQEMLFNWPFEPSLETDKKVHPLPPPALGIKPEPKQGQVPQYKA